MKRIPVLYENDFCMILRKPAGLAVQGGKGVGASLDSILAASFPFRPLLVHRLDKDTSGLILVAKDRTAAAAFSRVFTSAPGNLNQTALAERPSRQYLAIIKGVPVPPKGIICADLEIRGQNKKSETAYRLLGAARNRELPFSLAEMELGTGRMHQIRRHLLLINHPVLGDDKYGDFSLNRELRKSAGLRQLLLHAWRLVVPRVGSFLPQGLDIKDPLPDYFIPFLNQLDNYPVF